MCRAVADMIGNYLRTKPASLVCLASGHTPLGVFECLVTDIENNKLDISQCEFVGLDEWVGMNGRDVGSCRHMMDEAFFLPLGIPASRIHFFDGRATDLQAEVDRINHVIDQRGQLDIMLVGLGTNGHVAMNEPGTPFQLKAHISELAEETKTVGQKYFKTETPLDEGITLGLKNFSDSKLPILIANGPRKTEIVKMILTEKPGPYLPGSIVQQLPNCVVALDQEAAALL